MRSVIVGCDDSQWRQVLGSIRGTRVRIRVDCPPCHRRTLRELPPVSRAKLRGIVASNSERYFPLSASPLVTDAAWIGRGRLRSARAYAISTDLAENVLACATSAHCIVVDIMPNETKVNGCSLLPPVEVLRRRRWDAKRTATLAGLTIALAFVAMLLATAGLRRTRAGTERAAPAPEAVQLAARLRKQLSDATRAQSAFERDRATNSDLLTALSAIARSLSDSDQLTSLEIVGARVRELGVLSNDPAQLMSGLRLSEATQRLNSREAPTLVRRGEDWWTHLLLKLEEHQDGPAG